MRSLRFKRLVLVSDTTKSGNQFELSDRFNLITGRNNSIGKSTLAKCLFWAIGCEPKFDDTWKSLDTRAMLEFSVGEDAYVVIRASGTLIFGRKDGLKRRYARVTGGFSKAIASLVGFKVLLPNRAEVSVLETPSPAYYFLPFYIDQLRGWSTPWDSFENLGQYRSWRPTVVKYHTGYLRPEYFDLERAIYEYRDIKAEAEIEVKRLDTAIEVVKEYVPKNNLAITTEEFNVIAAEVTEELEALAQRQAALLDTLTKSRSLQHHLLTQLELAERARKEISDDYDFSVEYIEGDTVECPLCGTFHDNSLISRATILADMQQADEQVATLRMKLEQMSAEIQVSQIELRAVRERISEINAKYRRLGPNGEETASIVSFVDGFASRAVQRGVERTKTDKQSAAKNAADKQYELKREQRNLLSAKDRDELGGTFLGFLSEFLTRLNAQEINLSGVKHPTDYRKIFGSGGAAASTRAVLAYQLAIFKHIHSAANEVPAPLVIDTPNQHEQASHNYEKIVDLLMSGTPESSQIIMCAMHNDRLSPFREKAKIIELTDDKLMGRASYELLRGELDEIMLSVIP